MAASEALRLAVDIGGTFTDVAAADGDGRILATAKTPTTAAPAEGALAGVRLALADLGRGLARSPASSTARRSPPMR
jgi:N-methylhydantoinase A